MTVILDGIPKVIYHKPAADIIAFDFSKMFKARSHIQGRSSRAIRQRSVEAAQFNGSIAGMMLSICEARAAAVRQCNQKYTAVREGNLTFLEIDAAITQEATGGFPKNIESESEYGMLNILLIYTRYYYSCC